MARDFEHAQRTKADRRGRADGFGQISDQIKKMIGSHAHQEGDLGGLVIFERVGHDVDGGIPIRGVVNLREPRADCLPGSVTRSGL